MAYWCDDRALDYEQRRLDAEQARAAKAMAEKRNNPQPEAETPMARPTASALVDAEREMFEEYCRSEGRSVERGPISGLYEPEQECAWRVWQACVAARAQAQVPSVEEIARAREIIAESCGCHRDCGTSDGEVVTCGCERDARAVFAIRGSVQIYPGSALEPVSDQPLSPTDGKGLTCSICKEPMTAEEDCGGDCVRCVTAAEDAVTISAPSMDVFADLDIPRPAAADGIVGRAIGRLRRLHPYAGRDAWERVVAEEMEAEIARRIKPLEAENKRAVASAYERAARLVEDRGPATQDMTSTAICAALDEAAAAIRNLTSTEQADADR